MAADANSALMRYVVESTYGTNPGGTFDYIDFTGESLGQQNGTIRSQIIRADRQVKDIIRNSVSAGGDINFEWLYGGDGTWVSDFAKYALLDTGETWGSETTVISADTSVEVNGGGLYEYDSGGSGTWDNNPSPGEWIEVRGFTEAANNGYKKVTAATDDTITTDDTLTTEAAGDTVTIIQGAYLHNGTTLNTLSIEKEWDASVVSGSNRFHLLTGMAIASMTQTWNADTIMTGTAGFLGKSMSTATSTGAGGDTASPDNQVYNAVDHLAQARVGASDVTVIGADWDLQNNLRVRQVAGTLGAISVGKGQLNVTGAIRAYFEATTGLDDFLNHTTTSWDYVIEDDAGNAFVFDFPQVKLTLGTAPNEGIDTDVTRTYNFEAYRDSSETNHHAGTGGSDGTVAVDGVTMRIARFAA